MTDVDLPGLDDEITRLPQDIRADLAERGRNDLYFFAKGVMGYSDMTERCHKPLCVFLDQHPALQKLVLMPRGHFKSSIATIARTAQKVVRDPNERILVVNEVADNAENFLSAIKQHAESNKIFRALYSEIIPKDTRRIRWSGKELEFNRQWHGPEPTVSAMGMTSTLTSRHYTHLACDDPISEDAVKSPTVMQDAITRIGKFRSLQVKPKSDTFDLVGTRWALHDVYSFFMKALEGEIAIFARAATVDGELIFPELISQEILASIRNVIGEYAFSCLYMNNPRDIANQDFNVQDLRFWKWSRDQEAVMLYNPQGEILREVPLAKLDINVSVDLAMSEKVTSDRNAVVVTGCTPTGDVVVLDTWVQRCTPLQVIEQLCAVITRFRPRQVGIESIMYQKSLKHFLKQELERRGLYANITDLKAIPSKRGTGNNSKEARIRGLQPIAATGHLYILPTQHELRNELADFPLGEHDDTIDALAHQLTMWRGLLGTERMKKYKASEERILREIRTEDLAARHPHRYQYESFGPHDRPHPDDLGIELPQFSRFEDFVLTERM